MAAESQFPASFTQGRFHMETTRMRIVAALCCCADDDHHRNDEDGGHCNGGQLLVK